jgi:alpha-beta hydrolase superfamily lysophospholipase
MAERGSSKFAGLFAGLEAVATPPVPPAAAPPRPVRTEKTRLAAPTAPQPVLTDAVLAVPVLPPAPALPVPPPVPALATASKAAPVRATRRAGKRSDPAYKQFSVLLRKDTHRQAVRALYDADPVQDVSELVQQLLEQWVKRQQPAS